MTDMIAELRSYLAGCKHGPLPEKDKVARLLANCWDELDGGGETNMTGCKLLRRIETPTWEPPCLRFDIERHGTTVYGSSRGTVYSWCVDVVMGVAVIECEQRRQLDAIDARLNVKAIAVELARAIVSGKSDERLKVQCDGSIMLMMSKIIETTNKQTTTGRRRRFKDALRAALGDSDWEMIRNRVYKRKGRAI